MGRQKNVADSYYSGGKIAEAKYDWIQKKRQFFLIQTPLRIIIILPSEIVAAQTTTGCLNRRNGVIIG